MSKTYLIEYLRYVPCSEGCLLLVTGVDASRALYTLAVVLMGIPLLILTYKNTVLSLWILLLVLLHAYLGSHRLDMLLSVNIIIFTYFITSIVDISTALAMIVVLLFMYIATVRGLYEY